LANLNTGRLIWNPEGLHIRSVQVIELLLVSVVAYLIAAAQLSGYKRSGISVRQD